MTNRDWAGLSSALLCFACLLLPACSDDDGGSGGSGSGGSGGSSSSSGQSSSTSAAGGNSAGGNGAGGDSSGGSSAGGNGAGGNSMGASAACQMCVESVYTPGSDCATAIQDCDSDTACNDWKNCNEDCFNGNDTPACYQACVANFPHDTNLSDPLLNCTCGSCATECPAACSIQ